MAITPCLYYEDIEAALAFLSKAFGFRQHGRPLRGADGMVDHAVMRPGKDLVMMGRPGAGCRNPGRLGQATQSLRVNVPDVDRHFRRAASAGATVLEQPVNTECGHRRYGVTAPEGHERYFAREIRRAKSKGKRCRRTRG